MIQRVVGTSLPLRQKILPAAKCRVCGYPLQAVHTGGKTVSRCSNADCSG